MRKVAPDSVQQKTLISSHVKGSYGRLCLYPDSLLYPVGYYLWGIRLAIHIFGDPARGLVVFDAIECSRL